MRKGLISVLLWLGLLAGCNGEPTYQGVSFITYNYTPWELSSVRLIDASGAAAGTSAIPPGGGEGSVTCCYTLKGTEFTVKWRGGDVVEMRTHLFDGKLDGVIFNKEEKLHFPATKIPDGEGPVILELHIYPDEHMEPALSRSLFGQVRIPIVDTTRWLYEKHREALGDYRNIHEVGNVLGKVAKRAWTRYGIENAEDMRGYMYLYFVVASDFDRDPELGELLKDTSRKPGDFGRAVSKLSKDRVEQIKVAGTAPGDKNV